MEAAASKESETPGDRKFRRSVEWLFIVGVALCINFFYWHNFFFGGDGPELAVEAAAFTGRPFESRVALVRLDEQELNRRLKASFDAVAVEREMKVLRAFGIPKEDGLRDKLRAMLAGRALAYYDPEPREVVVLDQATLRLKIPRYVPKLEGVSLQGKMGDELGRAMMRGILLHEYVHANQDQTVPWLSLLQQEIPDDDLMFALRAALEGEAMRAYHKLVAPVVRKQCANRVKQGVDLSQALAQQLGLREARGGGWDVDEVLQLGFAKNAFRKHQGALGFFAWKRAAPYDLGMVYQVYWSHWNKNRPMLETPPLSTTELMDALRWTRDGEARPPRLTLRFREPARLLGAGWRLVAENTMGRARLKKLSKMTGNRLGGPGWRGDRYAVFENGDRLAAVLYVRYAGLAPLRHERKAGIVRHTFGNEEVTILGLPVPSQSLEVALRTLRSVAELESRDLERIVTFLTGNLP